MITRMVDLKGKFIRNVIEFQIRYKQGQDYIKNVFKVSSIFQITGLLPVPARIRRAGERLAWRANLFARGLEIR